MSTALRDPESGLLNHDYFDASLPTRVATARRVLRPLSVALLDAARDAETCPPGLVQQVAYGLLKTLRQSDTPCRRRDGGFAVILEDTPEDGAVWSVERLRRLLATHGVEVTIWAGIASYPAHALEAAQLMERAETALRSARQWGERSRIEVAVAE